MGLGILFFGLGEEKEVIPQEEKARAVIGLIHVPALKGRK